MLLVPVRKDLQPLADIPQPCVDVIDDDIDYDCRPIEIPVQHAVRLHEQEEFLEDIYKPEPTFGALLVRLFIVWSPLPFWSANRRR